MKFRFPFAREKKTRTESAEFEVSPAKQIKFADGTVLHLNRAQRRRMKIYNRDLRSDKE